MKITINNPAPQGPTLEKWGDFHFGASLQNALERQGVEVSQNYWPHWDEIDEADAVIVLRGLRRYSPPRDGRPWLLWIISHPATVTSEEVEAYALVCPASETMRRMLEPSVDVPLHVLRQCTDTTIFTAPELSEEEDMEFRQGLLFVANSRKVRRQMVQWALDTGLRPDLIGREWNALGLKSLVLREYVANRELPELYRSYRLSLNDHWGDMRHFGIINNRIFDCLACGLPVLSDTFPELKQVVGSGILYANDEREYWDAIWWSRTHYRELLNTTRKTWQELADTYSFDARAAELVQLINQAPAKGRSRGQSKVAKDPGNELAGAIMDLVAGSESDTCRILHVQPQSRLAGELALLERVSSISAGIGNGPWEIALDDGATQLAEDWYDAVILDQGRLEQRPESQHAKDFLRGLCRALKPAGYLLASPEVPETDASIPWSMIIGGMGSLVELAAQGEFAVFRKGAEN